MHLPWWWRRVAIATVLIAVLAIYIIATVTRWQFPFWAPVLAGALIIVMIAALSGPRPRSSRRAGTAPGAGLYASDPYSDIELGRLPPRHPHHDPNASSQVGGLLPEDPLRLPPPPDRLS